MVKTRSSTKDAKSKASSVGHSDDQEAAVLPSMTPITSTAPPPQQLAVPTLHQVSSPPATGFLKLSAELRNEIYKLCLHSDEPIDIRCHLWVEGPPRLNLIEPGAYSLNPNLLATYPNLLATCKTIRNEATSILYGSNTFVFSRVISVGSPEHDKHIRIHFFAQIGIANCRLIRQVELRNIPRDCLSSAFDVFARLHGLKSLVIQEGYAIGFHDPQEWSKHLAPMMRAWSQARSGEDVESLLDILQFRPSPPRPEPSPAVSRKGRTIPIRPWTYEQFKSKVMAALVIVTKQGQREFDRQRQLREMLRMYSDDELEQYKLHRALLG